MSESPIINKTISKIKPLDEKAMASARARQNQLTKPQGSLGRLEEFSIKLAGIQRRALPRIINKAVITMAGDHGVTAENISAYPAEVTAQMIANFLSGGAAINVIAKHVTARVIIVDMGVAAELPPSAKLISRKICSGTHNMCTGPALTRQQAIKSVETGIEIVLDEVTKGLDIVATGDMGIGNTTASAAICAVVTGKNVRYVTGRGTGIDNQKLEHKIAIIEQAINVNKPDAADGLDILAKVGGLEIGGLAGVMLGAAAYHVPVVIDGFISGAAALIATTLAPQLKDYLIAGHVSTEPGHKQMLKYLSLNPLLDLNMRLGEGTGAALGMFLAEISAAILNDMATFTEAGVTSKTN